MNLKLRDPFCNDCLCGFFAMPCIQRRGFTGIVLLFVALAVKSPPKQIVFNLRYLSASPASLAGCGFQQLVQQLSWEISGRRPGAEE
jgi:hypothetical protein